MYNNNAFTFQLKWFNLKKMCWYIYVETDDTQADVSNLLVTASHAIFHSEDKKSAPIAVVGYTFQHSAFQTLFKNITSNVSWYA